MAANIAKAVGQTGLVIVPCGEGWLVGEAVACGISCQSQAIPIQAAGEGGFKQYVYGRMTTDINLTCLGQPTIVDKRPMLLNDATVLELLRQVRRKQKERGE